MRMRITHTRAAAAASAVIAGGVAAYTILPPDAPVAHVAANAPAVQYRTQVIKKTIYVVRHEHPKAFPQERRPVAPGGGGPRPTGSAGSSVRTSASGHHGG